MLLAKSVHRSSFLLIAVQLTVFAVERTNSIDAPFSQERMTDGFSFEQVLVESSESNKLPHDASKRTETVRPLDSGIGDGVG